MAAFHAGHRPGSASTLHKSSSLPSSTWGARSTKELLSRPCSRPSSAAKLRRVGVRGAGLGARQHRPSLEAWTLYDLDRSGLGTASASRRPASRGKLVDGLAPSTSTVNRRVEELEAEEDVQPIPMSPKKDTRRQSIMFAPELKDILSPEDANKSFENVESVLQELKMSFQMEEDEEVAGSEEEMLKREEKKKKELLEARRNREKARSTKDPRRRVAAMLEQGRDWGQARPDQVRDRKVKVPMQVYTSLHATGAERIEMVDVHTLQGRCKGLSAGSCNYKEVRNLAEEEERQAKWLNATAPLEPKDFIKENKAQLGFYTIDLHEESRYRAEIMEAKLQLAKKRKERAEEEKTEQKIAMMFGRRRFTHRPGTFSEVLSGYLRRISAKEQPSSKQPEEEDKPTRIWSTVRGSLFEAVEYKWKDRRKKVVATQVAAAKRASFPELLRRKIERRGRMRKLRAVMKGVCGFIAMQVRVFRRYHAQKMMVHLLTRIIEASAAKEAVKKFNSTVKQIQRAFRSFLRRKRAWCKKASKLWMHVEDKHLADFYSFTEKESREDATSRRSSGSRRASSRPERNSIRLHEPFEGYDQPWKAMRIPKEHRMYTLGRFFIFKVKHHRLQLDVCQDMTSVEAAAARDMEEFFALPTECDEDEKRVGEEIGHLFEQKGIWLWAQISITKAYAVEVDEEDLVNLIALAACELSGVSPFQDHPASGVFQVNQGKSSARFWRIIHRQVEYKDNPSSPGRRCWGQLCRKHVIKTTKAKKPGLDSVMKRFSPRFLQEAAAETEVPDEAYASAVPLPLDEESDLDMYAVPGDDAAS